MKPTINYYFAKILKEHDIYYWTVKDFRRVLAKYGVIDDTKNLHRLYSLLRKHVNEKFLVKKRISERQPILTYCGTAKLTNMKMHPIAFHENHEKIQQKIEEIKVKQKKLNMEIHIADKILEDFPFIKTQVQEKKKQLQREAEELTAYVCFLNNL